MFKIDKAALYIAMFETDLLSMLLLCLCFLICLTGISVTTKAGFIQYVAIALCFGLGIASLIIIKEMYGIYKSEIELDLGMVEKWEALQDSLSKKRTVPQVQNEADVATGKCWSVTKTYTRNRGDE
jgi:hypothetical protein